MLGRGRQIAHLPWSGQATHAVAGQLERVVRPQTGALGAANEVGMAGVLVNPAAWVSDEVGVAEICVQRLV